MDEREIWEKVRPADEQKLELGDYYSHVVRKDTRFLLFSMSRYKFCARMIGDSPDKKVIELGCNEGLGALLLKENTGYVQGVDFDEDSINWAKNNLENETLKFRYDNFLGKSYGAFNALVCLDVIEHTLPENQGIFMETVLNNMDDNGVCIIGTPNKSSAKYASDSSRDGHVCMYNANELKAFFQEKFHNVFLFGMNDEVLHTGFYDMCHYLFVMACNKR